MGIVNFAFSNLYKPMFTTDKRFIDLWGGRGRGGSHTGTEYFLFLITQPEYFRGYFLRQVMRDIKDSLFQDFKDRLQVKIDAGELKEQDFNINESNYSIEYYPTGHKIISKGVEGAGQRTAKLKSLAGATHVLIEEADEMGEDDFNQLNLSLRTTASSKLQIIRIFNPPQKTHWIWRDYNLFSHSEGWYRAEPKQGANVTSIFSTYYDNIANLDKGYIQSAEAFKENDQEYYNNVILGLIGEGAKGRIYSNWTPITNEYYNSLDLPKAYGLDFGYSSDPTALIEVKFDKDHRYVKKLIYEAGLDNKQLAEKLHSLGLTIEDVIVADYGGGGDERIARLRRGEVVEGELRRFNVHYALKGGGSVKAGINNVKSTKVHYIETDVDIEFEYQEYKWRLDIDKQPTDTPIDKHNHIMDCLRYVESRKGALY